MPRISEERIYDLIGSIYDRAREKSPTGWSNVFNDIASLVSSGPGGLSLYSEKAKQFTLVAGTTQPEFLKSYSEHYQYVSPFRDAVTNLKAGQRFSRMESCSDDKFEQSEIYQDFFKKQDVFEFEYQVLFDHGGLNAGLSFSRPKSNQYFSPTERHAISLIVPHLHRGFQVYLELAEALRSNLAMADALSKMPRCVIVVDRSRNLVFANSTAETLLSVKNGIETDPSGMLIGSGTNGTKKLVAALNAVFEPSLNIDNDGGGVLQLNKPSGGRPLQVLVSPFTERDFSADENERLAILFVHDPDLHTETAEAVLTQIYGLTSAEARLTAILADGKSLNEACDILEVTQNTARTHLKRVFSKTDTNRQTELVKLVIKGHASLIAGRGNTKG